MTRIFYAGADIREPIDLPDGDWTQDRRERYLLRPDVVRPLSVDPNVWGRASGLDGGTLDPPLAWISADEVRRRAAQAPGTGDEHWVMLAIGVVAEDADEQEALAKDSGIDAELKVEEGWEFLGFDVADGTTSGLSNCGYDGTEADQLRSACSHRLNEHGLFSDLADALSFRRITDQRVPEHAPFRVYGLWAVQPAGQRGEERRVCLGVHRGEGRDRRHGPARAGVGCSEDREGATKAELARRIGAKPEIVRRLFTASSANPTVTTVITVAKALGFHLALVPSRSIPTRKRAAAG